MLIMGLLVIAYGLAQLQSSARNAGRIDFVGQTVLFITKPASINLGNALDGNARFWSTVFKTAEIRAENERLKSLEASWRQYQEAVDSLESQLNNVRRTVGLNAVKGKVKIAADIIAFDPVTSRITLSAGSRQGVEPGQAVVATAGLVGQIQSVDRNNSQALLVSSPVLRIGAMIGGQPPVTGLIRGQGPRRLVFELIESSRTYNQGELVVTSIHSERTPPNIPIGIVLSQEPAQEYGIARIVVAPTVEISEVREVFILK
ncbi:MAG: rod shape-determining protein MreC [Chthonomonas sp.]|nr:rod shape-determining protein MreC [Chthonomonas sp.]